MHHVRTLKILLHVYMYELRERLLMEEAKLERLFRSVNPLLMLHQHFLNSLKLRRKHSQVEESPSNYQITQLGDILISQVGQCHFFTMATSCFCVQMYWFDLPQYLNGLNRDRHPSPLKRYFGFRGLLLLSFN